MALWKRKIKQNKKNYSTNHMVSSVGCSVADDENVQHISLSLFFYDDDEIILDAAWGKEHNLLIMYQDVCNQNE